MAARFRLRAAMRILAGLSVLFALVTTMAAEKPYDFAGTPGKLPKQVVPLEYAIRIVPDLGKLTFAGSEKIKVKATASVREFVLNSAELEIAKASVDGTQLSPDAIKLDPDNELLTIALPKELPAGEHVLGLEFSEKISARHPIRTKRCPAIFSGLGRAKFSRALPIYRGGPGELAGRF